MGVQVYNGNRYNISSETTKIARTDVVVLVWTSTLRPKLELREKLGLEESAIRRLHCGYYPPQIRVRDRVRDRVRV